MPLFKICCFLATIASILTGPIAMANGKPSPFDQDKVTGAIESFFALEGQAISLPQIKQQIQNAAPMQHPDLGPLLDMRGPLGTLWVSTRNHVVYYSGSVIRGKAKPVEAAEGLEIAHRFVKRHVADFEQRNFVAEPVEADTENLTLAWNERAIADKETSIFPNWIEIAVDLTQGRVRRFSASDARMARTTPPKIDQQQAEAIIKSGFEKAAIDDIELMEQPIWDQKRVITIWTAEVLIMDEEGPVTVRVTIDADTGEVIPEE